jgi:hypothetical protein
LFARCFRLPATTDGNCDRERKKHLAFYGLNPGDRLKLQVNSDTDFNACFGSVSKPSCDNCEDLSWAAYMPNYAGRTIGTAKRTCLEDPVPRVQGLASANFGRGRLSVARLEFDHVYQFIQAAQQQTKPLADALKLKMTWHGWRPRLGTCDLTFELQNSNDLIAVVGSAPYEDVADPGGTPHLCGEPLVHHEILYNFSKRTPKRQEIAIPVCLDLRRPDKHPEIGTCVPFTFMEEDVPMAQVDVAMGRSADMPSRSKMEGLSLHIGVNEYSINFPADNDGFPVQSLRSSVFDANAMQQLARDRGFRRLPLWDDVLEDEEATVSALDNTLAAYAAAIADDGVILLTYSGLGIRQVDGNGGGWCMYTRPFFFSELKRMIRSHFTQKQGVRFFVITDACFSEAAEDASRRESGNIKVLPQIIADKFFGHLMQQIAVEQFRSAPLEEHEETAQGLALKPTIYFLSACDKGETTPDGNTADDPSLFTGCVIKYVSKSKFDDLRYALEYCTQNHPKLTRSPRDEGFEKLGPFRVPSDGDMKSSE